jgi:cytochrome P450
MTLTQLGFFQRDFAKTLSPETSGGLFTYHALGCRRVIPFSPNAVSYFTNSRNYVRTEITRQAFKRITGEGLLYVEGEEHRRQRRILSPAFASQHIKELIPIFWSKGCELAATLSRLGVAADKKKGLEVFTLLPRTTLDIIGLAGLYIWLNGLRRLWI